MKKITETVILPGAPAAPATADDPEAGTPDAADAIL